VDTHEPWLLKIELRSPEVELVELRESEVAVTLEKTPVAPVTVREHVPPEQEKVPLNCPNWVLAAVPSPDTDATKVPHVAPAAHPTEDVLVKDKSIGSPPTLPEVCVVGCAAEGTCGGSTWNTRDSPSGAATATEMIPGRNALYGIPNVGRVRTATTLNNFATQNRLISIPP
jgi:hypothetical protein